MNKLIAGALIAGLLSGHVQATSLQYPPSESQANAPQGHSSGSNVVPILAIAGAVVTTGLILFKVHKVKQARKARFNIYVVAKGAN